MFKKVKHISNVVKISLENFSKIGSTISKKIDSKNRVTEKDYSLRDAIIQSIYSPPRGFLIILKEKIFFFRISKKNLKSNTQSNDTNQSQQSTDEINIDVEHVEEISLHVFNNKLVKTVKKKKSLNLTKI